MAKKFIANIINSNKNLATTFIVIIAVSALLYSISEGTTFIDALWWSIVTATTVGYGDSFPHNMLGKMTAITLMLTMVLLIIPAITARMASGLIVNHDAFTHEEQEDIKQAVNKMVEYLEKEEKLRVHQPELTD